MPTRKMLTQSPENGEKAQVFGIAINLCVQTARGAASAERYRASSGVSRLSFHCLCCKHDTLAEGTKLRRPASDTDLRLLYRMTHFEPWVPYV